MKSPVSAWAVGIAMVAVAVASNVFVPTAQPDLSFNLDRAIPEAFGDWTIDTSVVPIAPSPDVQASLDKIYDQILSRTYRNSNGSRMMLVVAYGGDQSDSLKAHRQEVCYQAQGFSVKDVRGDQLRIAGQDVPLVRLHATKGRRSEPVTYWFTMADEVAIGRAERLAKQIGHGLQGRIPDGLLLRVSSLSSDPAASYAEQDEFLNVMLKSVAPATRQRLAGLESPSS